jgi:hypothetical protein
VKHLETTSRVCETEPRSASMSTPRLRIVDTELTAMMAMMTGATGSDEERRADEHHVTSVLSALSWRRLEPIQSAMAVEQSETAADRAAVLSERHEPYIWLRLAIVGIQVVRQTVGGNDVL